MSAAPGRARAPRPSHQRTGEVSARLRQAENLAALNTLLAGIAHNLANPLTSIGSFLEMLPERWDSSEEFRDRDYRRALADLSRVQEQIESLTRIAVGPELSEAEPWKVERLTAELQLYGLGSAGGRGISFASECGCPEAVSTQSREVLKQIMIVLLDNAIEFAAPKGRVVLRIHTAPGEQGDHLHMLVCDDGAGVPTASASKIFEPFYTTRPGGMGVGLFVGRQLARAYGGELALVHEGKGASFELVMPLQLA